MSSRHRSRALAGRIASIAILIAVGAWCMRAFLILANGPASTASLAELEHQFPDAPRHLTALAEGTWVISGFPYRVITSHCDEQEVDDKLLAPWPECTDRAPTREDYLLWQLGQTLSSTADSDGKTCVWNTADVRIAIRFEQPSGSPIVAAVRAAVPQPASNSWTVAELRRGAVKSAGSIPSRDSLLPTTDQIRLLARRFDGAGAVSGEVFKTSVSAPEIVALLHREGWHSRADQTGATGPLASFENERRERLFLWAAPTNNTRDDVFVLTRDSHPSFTSN